MNGTIDRSLARMLGVATTKVLLFSGERDGVENRFIHEDEARIG